MQRPIGEGQLQQPNKAVEGVVNRHNLAKVGEAEEGAKDGKVAAVQHEATDCPQDQCHHLLHRLKQCSTGLPR